MLQSFPSITQHEFSQACQGLEQKCHDRLDGTGWVRAECKGDGFQIRKSISRIQSNEHGQRREVNNPVEESKVEDPMGEDQVRKVRSRCSLVLT